MRALVVERPGPPAAMRPTSVADPKPADMVLFPPKPGVVGHVGFVTDPDEHKFISATGFMRQKRN